MSSIYYQIINRIIGLYESLCPPEGMDSLKGDKPAALGKLFLLKAGQIVFGS
jgi:hypothetical protein